MIDNLTKYGFEVNYQPGIQRDQLLKMVADYDVLVFRGRMRVDKELIDLGSNLKILARYGVGLDNVDVDYAISKGIAVVNVPTASTVSVAELTMALILSLFRNLYYVIHSVKTGLWPKGEFVGRELNGKKLGIIGFGRIGGRVAYYGRAFGMKILAYDVRNVSRELRDVEGVQVDLTELLSECDVITLHVPLTPSTYRMLNDKTLSFIREGSFLTNVNRGEVIDTAALIKHLDRLGGVALDVLEEEPPRSELMAKLVEHPKVIVTPHIGSETVEAMDRLADELIHNILEVIRWL